MILGPGLLVGEDASELREELRQIRQENALLQKQLEQQQRTINSLSKTVNDIQAASGKSEHDLTAEPRQASDMVAPTTSSLLGKVNISGEGGVGFFKTGADGTSSHGEFRLDEARLFLDAQGR